MSENADIPFPCKCCTRDCRRPLGRGPQSWRDICTRLCTHMQTRPLHPPRVRSIWVESGSQSLGDSQPTIVPSSYLETSHTQHSLMLEEPQPSIVNGLSWGGEACFQSVLPAILPPPPVRNQYFRGTWGEDTGGCRCPLSRSPRKGISVLSHMKWFLICRFSSFERYFCSLISTQK